MTTVAVTVAMLAMAGCSQRSLVESPRASTSTSVAATSGTAPGSSVLTGLRTVRPVAADPGDLADRMGSLDPGAVDVVSGAAAYDAVVLSALAVESARDDSPGAIAASLATVSGLGEACTTFARCRRLAEESLDVDYEGRSGGLQLLTDGELGEATFAIDEVTASGDRRTLERTTSAAAGSVVRPPAPDRRVGPGPDGVLRIGTLLPTAATPSDPATPGTPTTSGTPGSGDPVARSALAAVRLAVSDLDDDRGVLGSPVELVGDESGDGSPDAIRAAVVRLAEAGVDVVVADSTDVIDTVAVGPLTDLGVVVLSPTARDRPRPSHPDGGRYVRLRPSEELVGRLLARLATDDGAIRVAGVVAAGEGEWSTAAAALAAALRSADADLTTVRVDPAGDVDAGARAAADQIVAVDAQVVVVLAPPGVSARVLRALVERDRGPAVLSTLSTAGAVTDDVVALVGRS